ncbi:4Fe-4S binding domain-containing protein [Methanolobus vulcani]|jgi:NAD-dependent dihydropyrimidine dehydrogenase PreA subunit|uniref:4Fe-4S binding domain-containing protein n=1 Tax=Methanolobus vulcani TaxID=38026 RepID=A0A7Z7FEP6_9EURY|nr:4Fe-4S binding protein [Methanolobus vulcani]SDG01673.1 4Fe-4S binding domain-containing protein [Methanolobus vulcani]
MVFVAVYDKKCTGCGSCVDACQNGILELKDGICFPARMDSCKYCMTCVHACDFDAIKVFP